MKKIYLCLVLSFAVCGMVAVICHFAHKKDTRIEGTQRSQDSVKSSECVDRGAMRAQAEQIERKKVNLVTDPLHGYVSPYRLAAGKDYAMLVSGWSEAATNLVAGDVCGMETSIAKVSERMKTVPLGQRDEITQPFYAILKKRLDYKCVRDIFTDDADFETYMMATIKGMNLSAEIELNSYLVPPSAGKWEHMALATLRAYSRSFSASDKKALAEKASKLIKELSEQIESSRGLTYRYMHWLLKRDTRLLIDKGLETRDRVLRGIRTEAYPLQVDGCEPRWLEEFK